MCVMGDLLSTRRRPWALPLGPSTLLGQLGSLSPAPGVQAGREEAVRCTCGLGTWKRTALKELKMFLYYIYSLIVRNH